MTLVLRQFVGGGASGRLPVSPCYGWGHQDLRSFNRQSVPLRISRARFFFIHPQQAWPSRQRRNTTKNLLLGPRRRSSKALCVCSAETANSRHLSTITRRHDPNKICSSHPDIWTSTVRMSSPPAWSTGWRGPVGEDGQLQVRGEGQVAPKTPRDSLMSVPAHVAAAQNSHASPPGRVYSLSRRFQIVIAGSSSTSVLPPAICKAAQPWPRTHRITAQRPRVTIPPALLQSAQKEKRKMRTTTFIVRDVFPSSQLVSRSIISRPKTDRLNSYSQDGQPYARATKHP